MINKNNLVVFLTMAFLLSACGQSGPLYLPSPSKTATSMPSNHTTTQAISTKQIANMPKVVPQKPGLIGNPTQNEVSQ